VPAVFSTSPVESAPRFFSAESPASAAPTQYCADVGAPPPPAAMQMIGPLRGMDCTT
jgi:hypothetical protein